MTSLLATPAQCSGVGSSQTGRMLGTGMGGGGWPASSRRRGMRCWTPGGWEVLYMLFGEQVEEGDGKMVVGAEACMRKKGDRL